MKDEQELRLQKAELLLEISRTLARQETLDEMLSELVALTTQHVEADRGTIFLNDPVTDELYSRIAQGDLTREIRILNDRGVAGHVFQAGRGIIVHDAYSNEYFSPDIDKKTGYRTESILCAPIRTAKGDIIGVAQALNRKTGQFTEADLTTLREMTGQAAVALQSAQFIERMDKERKQEMEFVSVVSDITTEIDLALLLQKVMAETTRLLDAERSTLFLNDEKNDELFSQVGEGLGTMEIRLPNHAGIAGTVFTSGKTVNIPYAYADLRFNPSFDKKTGFFTRSILCTPIINKSGKIIGVTQALNKRGGPFTANDESRLKAFTAQLSIALENAKLFDDVQNMRNYNESILESMSNTVITLDEDGHITTCNAAGYRLTQMQAEDIIGLHHAQFFTGADDWVCEKVTRADRSGASNITMDTELQLGTQNVSVNLTVLPLTNTEGHRLGSMLVLEDISSEKRLKTTMSRYMDPGLADRLLGEDEDILGGKTAEATVLFSDIRNFTPLSEKLGAQETVTFLNDYFTLMVECIMQEDGMLDKFIGDAIMAAFGIPVARDDDEDRGIRAAVSMIGHLREWNRRRETAGQSPVDMGIGLNTDTVISGNIGSPKRMDYTLIGDGVNLASRLESACKYYNTRILISGNTYRKLRGTYRAREIDRVVVKGKTDPVDIYEVLDYHDSESFPNLMDTLNCFAEGLGHYREGKWDRAIRAFNGALEFNPADEVSRTYIARCKKLRDGPPREEWDGIWEMTTK